MDRSKQAIIMGMRAVAIISIFIIKLTCSSVDNNRNGDEERRGDLNDDDGDTMAGENKTLPTTIVTAFWRRVISSYLMLCYRLQMGVFFFGFCFSHEASFRRERTLALHIILFT